LQRTAARTIGNNRLTVQDTATSISLAAELAPFNIRVLCVRPGAIDTALTKPAGNAQQAPLSQAYKGTPADFALQFIASDQYGVVASDPARLAQRMVEAVDNTGMFAGDRAFKDVCLPLGEDLRKVMEAKAEKDLQIARDFKKVAATTMKAYEG
jgi:hypothetical protein